MLVPVSSFVKILKNCPLQDPISSTHLSIISPGPWSIPTISLSWLTASMNAFSQNCILSHSEDLSFPNNASNRYVLLVSGLLKPNVLCIAPAWYRNPALSDDLLDHALGMRCLEYLESWNQRANIQKLNFSANLHSYKSTPMKCLPNSAQFRCPIRCFWTKRYFYAFSVGCTLDSWPYFPFRTRYLIPVTFEAVLLLTPVSRYWI